MAVLVAGRASQVPPPFRDAPLLELDGLPLQESSALVSTHYPGRWTPGLLQALHRATGGNPLALVEFGRDPAAITSATDELPHTLPSRLRVAFGRRLEALSPPERNVALVAAVVGEDLRLIRAVCDALSLDAGGLSSAAEAGLVTVSDNRVRFTHPLLRSVTYGSAPQALRASAHRAVADLIDPADADRRVWHRAAAADRLDEQVAGELVDLSARATARSAFSIAATALERAARLSPASADARLRLVAAASSAWAAGHGDQALRLLAEAEPAHTVPSAAGAELRAMITVRSGSVRTGLGMLEDAATIARADDAVILLAEACRACMYLVDMPELQRIRGRLVQAVSRSADDRARALGSAALAATGVLLGEGTADLLRQAVSRLTTGEDVLAQPAALPRLLLAPLFLRDVRDRAQLRDLVERVRAQVGIGALPTVLFHVAREQATSSSWDRAAANYDEAARLARETGQGAELAISLAGLAGLEARAGRAEDCRHHAADALVLCRERSLRFGEIWCELALGELSLSQGKVHRAAGRLDGLARRLEHLGVADPDLHPGPDLVDALVRIGHPEQARDAAYRFAGLAEATNRPWAMARAGRALGITAAEDGFDAPFAEALAHHRQTPDVFETARTNLAYGMRLRRAGRRIEARGVFREALAVFDDLGAIIWAGHARRELEATGERVPPRAPLGPDALTPQELQVCLLLAEGRTTREAAAALFLSPKTIEYHLRKAYTKLGIHSRLDLAVVLREAG